MMRDDFLKKVSEAVQRGNKHRIVTDTASGKSDYSTAWIGPRSDLVEHSVREINNVGARAATANSQEEAGIQINEWLKDKELKNILCNGGPVIEASSIRSLIKDDSIRWWKAEELAEMDGDARRDQVFAVDLGITAPDVVIAETGSLVYVSSPYQLRSTSLVPPIHLAIVEPDNVIADLMSLPEALRDRGQDGILPGNAAIVTGPSKTGDIELQLTTGVHGPGELYVLFLDIRAEKQQDV